MNERSRISSPKRGGQTGAAPTGEITTSESKTVSGEQVSESSETHNPTSFIESKTPAYVRVAGGKTINLGNYESMRIDVCVELPSEPTKEGIEQTYADAVNYVDQFMNQRLNS